MMTPLSSSTSTEVRGTFWPMILPGPSGVRIGSPGAGMFFLASMYWSFS